MQSEYCPVCSKNGAKVRVKAYQLNLEEAVFMCSTEECTWPVGYHELLFMDRPMGKYWTKDWPDIADKVLADYLKQQRDSLSELSAYTPPQTPGSSKDTVHDSSTAGPSSSAVIKIADTLDQQASSSKSKPFEIPVIDCTSDESSINQSKPIVDCVKDNTLIFENKIVGSESVSVSKAERSPHKVLFIKKESSATRAVIKSDEFLPNPLVKYSIPIVEKSLTNDNVMSAKYRFVSKKKTKLVNYKKQFDLFEDIKKAKSRIDLGKMKPNEMREVLFVNSKSKTNDSIDICKLESTNDKVIKLESQKQLAKEEDKICQSDVNNEIEIEINKSNTSSLIQTIRGDENVSLEFPNVASSNGHTTRHDLNKMINASPVEFADNNLDSLLAMLEDDICLDDKFMTTNSTSNDNVSASNATLKEREINKNISKDEKMEIDPIVEDDTLQCTIDDESDDAFFASLFSPPMNQ